MSTSVRITVLGAGSSYVPVLLSQLRALLPHTGLELGLYDIDPLGAERGGGLADLILPEATVVSDTDVARCLEGADLVIHLYRAGPADYRRLQEVEARRLGLIGQETQGFGGGASAMFNIAAMRVIAPDALAVCPDALHLFITNPTGVMTAAAAELGLRSVGLCELPYVLQQVCSEICGPGIELDYVGLNHFAWIVGGRRDGTDCSDQLLANAAQVLAQGRPPNIPLAVPERVIDLFEAIPSPYLAYYYATRLMLELQEKSPTRADQVAEVNRQADEALERGDVKAALDISRGRGGYMLGEATRTFLLAWIGIADSEMILCSPDHPCSRSYSGGPVAHEMPMAVSEKRLSPRQIEARMHPHLVAMLGQMEAYESLLVKAGLDEDLEIFEQALLTHPLVREAEAAHTLAQVHAAEWVA